MAIGATIHTLDVQLADLDRGVYEQFSLRVAKHPSETDAFMLTRILAYCLEYREGIAFGAGGVSSTDEPAVLVRDLTGRITTWIEVGAPSAERLHGASKLADRTVVYSHRDPLKLLDAWNGKKIHRAEEVALRSFDARFIDQTASALSRRASLSVSVTEGHLYLEVDGATMDTAITEHTAA